MSTNEDAAHYSLVFPPLSAKQCSLCSRHNFCLCRPTSDDACIWTQRLMSAHDVFGPRRHITLPSGMAILRGINDRDAALASTLPTVTPALFQWWTRMSNENYLQGALPACLLTVNGIHKLRLHSGSDFSARCDFSLSVIVKHIL